MHRNVAESSKSAERPRTAGVLVFLSMCAGASWLFALGMSAVQAEEAGLKQGAKKVGHAAGTVVREVGQGAKKVGKTIGQAAKEGGKEFHRAVKGEQR